jgi:fluoride exporter
VLAVALGGGAGAVLRYWVEGVVVRRQRTPFPLSTLIVNVSGSIGLGLVVAAMLNGDLPAAAGPWVVTGFFGGYTTFSTFVYETVRLVEDGAWRYVAWNLALSGPLSFLGAGLAYWAILA